MISSVILNNAKIVLLFYNLFTEQFLNIEKCINLNIVFFNLRKNK